MGVGGGGHWLVRMEWRPARWSVCLPLLIFPGTIKSRNCLLALAYPGGPGKRAVKRLWLKSISKKCKHAILEKIVSKKIFLDEKAKFNFQNIKILKTELLYYYKQKFLHFKNQNFYILKNELCFFINRRVFFKNYFWELHFTFFWK